MAKTSSYMKTYRAKKLQAGTPAQPTQNSQQTTVVPVQDAGTQNLSLGGSTTLDAIQSMTPDEFAAFMESQQNAANPMSAVLYDSPVQRLIYEANVNGLPGIVPESQFRQLPGTTLYRTVNQAYDRDSDVNHPADRIARQTMKSSYNRIGGGISGDGLYFADSRSDSTVYGNVRGDVKQTAVMKAKLNANAKVVTMRQLKNELANEPLRLQNAMQVPNMKGGGYISHNNNLSAYALYKGYNVIERSGYYVVIDRSAITFSANITAK